MKTNSISYKMDKKRQDVAVACRIFNTMADAIDFRLRLNSKPDAFPSIYTQLKLQNEISSFQYDKR